MRSGALTVIGLVPSMSAGWFDGEGVADLRSRGAHAWILMRPVSYRGEAGPPTEQLEQIVGEADHGPLAPDFLDAAQRESPKAPYLLDLPEHRLGNRLAQGIHG